MLIRRELPGDQAAIRAVHSEAFRREAGVIPVEAPLVDELRAEGDLISALSLVAVREGAVVGHVCCSRARLGDDTAAAVGLGPLGEPAYYSRFGFVAAADLSITAPEPWWGRNFQARTLAAYEPTQAGAFEYAPAFSRI
ncbi:GNAT family N-acetyltransferase [Amycolatopsis sp. NPDC058278]|uniref:GNAT family N-acetyltransferase n=1 Tax=Amycolatopsis sp. NPDC058278 TaxID=3346417 RepID=UPI0036DEB135